MRCGVQSNRAGRMGTSGASGYGGPAFRHSRRVRISREDLRRRLESGRTASSFPCAARRANSAQWAGRSAANGTMDLDDPIALALAITEALRGRGVPHALYGGLLLAAYGEARETRDVDIAVTREAGARSPKPLLQACPASTPPHVGHTHRDAFIAPSAAVRYDASAHRALGDARRPAIPPRGTTRSRAATPRKVRDSRRDGC